MKPFSESCEENKLPILEVLREQFTSNGLVLEIGSGTGQHAVFFAKHLPHLVWQPSEVREHISGVNLWCEEAKLPNVLPPVVLDVTTPTWPCTITDYVFSANTAHILSWPEIECMFAGTGKALVKGGKFCLYGPFNYDGHYTSPSNARFDQWLRSRNPNSAIRHFEDLCDLAESVGMQLIQDYEMPVNNRLLAWQKVV